MAWPIDRIRFDKLMFDYHPEELGFIKKRGED